MTKDRINNRELSWLSFNERVLMEAVDITNPLLERLKFLAIFSSNLDEFFMVRVSGIYEQLSVGYNKPDFSGYTPKEALQEITATTHRLNDLQQKIFDDLKLELEKEHIFFPGADSKLFKEMLESIFLEEIMPVISPVTVDPSHPFPFIYGRRICLIVELTRNGKQFTSLITIPETVKRSYRITKGRTINIFKVEDIICQFLNLLYKGYQINSVGFFRVTRDADLEVTEEESADLLKSVEYSLSKRKHGDINRVEVNKDISPKSLAYLKKMMSFTDDELDLVKGTIDLSFLFSLTSLKESLMFPPLKQRAISRLSDNVDLFDEIKKKPIYLFRPYNSFSVVTDLVKAAANDDNVLAIKMTLYRTNSNSSIISSLLEAAKRGKQVSVVVELKARFDEERNIEWAKNLEQEGCIVTYGLMGLKVHAKCMLIVRREEGKIVRYTHVATGNYNENTAEVYTDVDIITSDEAMGRDATKLFNYLTGFTEEDEWERMSIAPFALRTKIMSMIDREIEFAKMGKNSKIIIKVNSLIDEIIIEKLYEASSAGVNIDLIVRGICGIKPGLKGISENIKVRSIVGRFLEHPRILYFSNNGDNNYFITSADLMQRNLNGRVELMVDIKDPDFKSSLEHYLNVSLKDNCKAWEMHDDKYFKLVPLDKDQRLSSQEYFLNNDI